MVQQRFSTKRVLVVDDEPDFAALLASILVRAGYGVATAYDCDDALSMARNLNPHLITLDIHMPRKSGVAFYHKLRSFHRFQHTPVIVVTGITRMDQGMETIVRQLLGTNIGSQPLTYVQKPIDADAFLETVGCVLGGQLSTETASGTTQRNDETHERHEN